MGLPADRMCFASDSLVFANNPIVPHGEYYSFVVEVSCNLSGQLVPRKYEQHVTVFTVFCGWGLL